MRLPCEDTPHRPTPETSSPRYIVALYAETRTQKKRPPKGDRMVKNPHDKANLFDVIFYRINTLKPQHSPVATFAPKKSVAGSTAVHFNHQCLKCKQWHIAHRLLLTEEGGIMQKKPLQRNVAGTLNSICNITTLL